MPPGALHARIVRPPAHGVQLVSVDTKAAEAVPGVRVVRDGDLVAVLHEHRDEADKALKLVKATYGPAPSTLANDNIFDHLEKNAPASRVVAEGGNVAEGEKAAAHVVSQKYLKGYVAHAPMETHSAVAAIAADGKVTVWASTQTPFPLQTQVARALKLPTEKVRVITPYVGGGFGGKSASQQAIEAARLAVAAGKPVRVVWDRTEEFFFDTFDPAAVINIRAGVDTSKKIVSWDYEVIGAGERGSQQFYDVANHRTVVRGGWNGNANGLHPFAIGPWRAPGANANAFAREVHIDMLANKAGMDPVEFRRLNLTKNARMLRVLQAAADKFGWQPKATPSKRGFGVALGDDAGTYVASIAQVKVDPATRRGAGAARGLRAGHGRRRESRGRDAAARGMHHDGARLHARRGGAVQGRRGARQELPDVPPAAFLVGAEDRGRAARLAGSPGAGRWRAGDRDGGRRGRQRRVRRDRRASDAAAADAGAGQGGDDLNGNSLHADFHGQ